MNQQSSLDPEATLTKFKLANAWQLRGQFNEAFARYQEILQRHPHHMPVYQQLGNLMLRQRRVEEALEYYDRALALDFEATDLTFYYQCLGFAPSSNSSPDQTDNLSFPNSRFNETAGKINLAQQKVFSFHRSGWNFAIHALSSLHNPQGVLFDGCLEHQFLFQHLRSGHRPYRILEKMRTDGVYQCLATSEEKRITPYLEPWVGFLHNPPAMPVWFNYHNSPQALFRKQIWQDSLSQCVGLFALSEYHAQWLRAQTHKPVSVLIHPTEIPECQFDFDRFLQNPAKKIVQIGWWLRKLNSLAQLPIARSNPLGYEKIRLGFLFDSAEAQLLSLMRLEAKLYKIEVEQEYVANTKVIQHLPNHEYDDLLSANIAFVDLYDSSANNAIIECIARATPLLINPLPAVKEYLGEDYPMYFETLREAAAKALDPTLILDTHEYLKSCETRQKLSTEYFLDSFCKSEVYQSL